MRIAALASGLMLFTLGITSVTVHGQRGPALPSLTVTSPAFQDGGDIPPKFTQADPKPISPKLDWINVPTGTVTFTLIMHDPEANIQKKDDALHWIAFNIPGTATGLPENVPADPQLPDGTVQPKNVTGKVGFLGPGAPPAGPQHHYTWTLYALDAKLELGPDATRADVLKAMEGHILGRGVLVGRFKR